MSRFLSDPQVERLYTEVATDALSQIDSDYALDDREYRHIKDVVFRNPDFIDAVIKKSVDHNRRIQSQDLFDAIIDELEYSVLDVDPRRDDRRAGYSRSRRDPYDDRGYYNQDYRSNRGRRDERGGNNTRGIYSRHQKSAPERPERESKKERSRNTASRTTSPSFVFMKDNQGLTTESQSKNHPTESSSAAELSVFQTVATTKGQVDVSKVDIEYLVHSKDQAFNIIEKHLPQVLVAPKSLVISSYQQLNWIRLESACATSLKSRMASLITKLESCSTFSTFLRTIVPIFSTLPSSRYTEWIRNRFNEMLGKYYISPENPNCFPVIGDWKSFTILEDKNTPELRTINETIRDFDTFVQELYLGLLDTFFWDTNDDGTKVSRIIDIEQHLPTVCAAPGLDVVNDNGPIVNSLTKSDAKEQITKAFQDKYLFFTTKQTSIFVKGKAKDILPANAVSILPGCGSIPEHLAFETISQAMIDQCLATRTGLPNVDLYFTEDLHTKYAFSSTTEGITVVKKV